MSNILFMLNYLLFELSIFIPQSQHIPTHLLIITEQLFILSLQPLNLPLKRINRPLFMILLPLNGVGDCAFLPRNHFSQALFKFGCQSQRFKNWFVVDLLEHAPQ